MRRNRRLNQRGGNNTVFLLWIGRANTTDIAYACVDGVFENFQNAKDALVERLTDIYGYTIGIAHYSGFITEIALNEFPEDGAINGDILYEVNTADL